MAHKIIIEAIASTAQRYDTLGDYWVDEAGDWHIRVTGDNPEIAEMDDQAFLYALHELIEMKLCIKRGISMQSIDDFDMKQFSGEGEPGDDPNSPYRKEHRFAMLLEHQMAHEMGKIGYGVVE